MNSVNDWLEAYGESHQDPLNKKIHWVCVPLIMLSLLGLFWNIPITFKNIEWLNLAILLVVGASIYYFKLSVAMGIGMLIISAAMLFLIVKLQEIGNQIYIIIFIISWAGQFIGHKIEGQKPSFFEDIQFLLIGPLWLLAQFYKAIGIKY